jgi:hypothetical protein
VQQGVVLLRRPQPLLRCVCAGRRACVGCCACCREAAGRRRTRPWVCLIKGVQRRRHCGCCVRVIVILNQQLICVMVWRVRGAPRCHHCCRCSHERRASGGGCCQAAGAAACCCIRGSDSSGSVGCQGAACVRLLLLLLLLRLPATQQLLQLLLRRGSVGCRRCRCCCCCDRLVVRLLRQRTRQPA